jgi:hypothetical protein
MMGDMSDSLALELRPPAEADLPMLEKLTTDPAATGEFANYGYHDPLRWRRGWAENELIGPDGGVLCCAPTRPP